MTLTLTLTLNSHFLSGQRLLVSFQIFRLKVTHAQNKTPSWADVFTSQEQETLFVLAAFGIHNMQSEIPEEHWGNLSALQNDLSKTVSWTRSRHRSRGEICKNN